LIETTDPAANCVYERNRRPASRLAPVACSRAINAREELRRRRRRDAEVGAEGLEPLDELGIDCAWKHNEDGAAP
jgi:hypothetical protein